MADAEIKEGEEQKPSSPKKKSRVGLILVIVAVLAVAGAAGAVFVIKPAALFGGETPPEEEVAVGGLTEPMEIGVPLPLEPFTLNLAAGSSKRVLKIALELEMCDESAKQAAQARTAAIRDTVITYLTSKRDVEINQDREMIKSELLRRLKSIVGDKAVKRVYFTELLMQ